MKCSTCQGTGSVWRGPQAIAFCTEDTPLDANVSVLITCSECDGSGITSCCEGACGGPDEVTNQGDSVERDIIAGLTEFRNDAKAIAASKLAADMDRKMNS